MIEPCHNQGTEQGIVGGLHLVIAYAVEQSAIDELWPNQPELALPQASKYFVVCYGFIIEFEKWHAGLMLLYPPVSALDEHCDLFGITAAAHHLDTLPLATHFLHDANRDTARFVLFLLNKHATKVALILQMTPRKADFLGGGLTKLASVAERGDPKRTLDGL